MTPKLKVLIAREWIILLVSLSVGLTVVPVLVLPLVSLVIPGNYQIADFYAALFGSSRFVRGAAREVFALALAPYALFQVFRSIRWAIKTLKSDER